MTKTDIMANSCRTCRHWQHHPLRAWYCDNKASPEYLEPKNRPGDVCGWWEPKYECVEPNAQVYREGDQDVTRIERC